MIRLQDLLSEVSVMLPWRNSGQPGRPMAAEMRSSVDPVLGPNATHMAPRKEKLTEYRSKYSIAGASGMLLYKGAKLKFDMFRRGRSTHMYTATLVSGKWPSDDALITLADGGDPAISGHPRHFGGDVAGNPGSKTKTVTVNVD